MPSFLVKQGGLPRWLSGKDSSCSAGDAEDMGLILELGRSPGEENDNPLQYSCLGNPTEELGELESMGLQRAQHSNGLPGLPSWLR